ncbi:hypothetical protein Tco_0014101 [Tanacetum coccineum]
MVVERKILYDFLGFFGVLIVKLSAVDVVNLTFKMKRDMIIENLDLEPKIDAMMRDFLKIPSRWKELTKEMSSEILPSGDGSPWKTFKPIVGLIAKGKLNKRRRVLSLFATSRSTFGKHLEEIHMTWAQFRKKRDRNTTLRNFDQALVYKSWKQRQDFHLTPSWFQGVSITSFCDGVKNIDHTQIIIPPPVPIEQFLSDFMNSLDVLEMDDLESDNESIDTPLVSPFLDSDEELDDGEVLNELNEYGNAGIFLP